MADFNITGNMKVETLKEKFKEEFGSTLRIYVGGGKHLAEDDRTLGDITETTVSRGSEFSAHGRTLCKKFEDEVWETFGFKVQVATPDNSALVDNSKSLTESGES
jgi:hypothetical protein